jgi:hypothetical protein
VGSVVEQWIHLADEQGMPEATVQTVAELMQRTLSSHALTTAEAVHPDLRDPFRRFIGEFRHAFTNRQSASGFSYYFVWLVGKAIRRGPVDQAILDGAKADFQQCVDGLAERLRAGCRQWFGADYAKHEKHIEAGIRRIEDRSMDRFAILQADPLFPLFKERLSADLMETALKSAVQAIDYDAAFSGVREEKDYARRLKSLLEIYPSQLLFELAQMQIEEQARHTAYWGPVLLTMTSTYREHTWPINVEFDVVEERDNRPATEEASAGAEP